MVRHVIILELLLLLLLLKLDNLHPIRKVCTHVHGLQDVLVIARIAKKGALAFGGDGGDACHWICRLGLHLNRSTLAPAPLLLLELLVHFLEGAFRIQ